VLVVADLNGDYSVRLVVDTNRLAWALSPAQGVWRRRVELLGDTEHGRVTSVVRYDEGARFPSHDHPLGEEILVLDGVFSDERGDFTRGTYQLNPPGFRHEPFTVSGCTLFVKLGQYSGKGREVVLKNTAHGVWIERGVSGVRSQILYQSAVFGEFVRLTEFAPSTSAPRIDLPKGEEIFVLAGCLEDEFGTYPAGTWIRMPGGSHHAPRSEVGCTLYVRSGAFPS
jgi:anti-sigma factor ChrR (cupin superfamily)